MQTIQTVLKEHFGYSQFREGQETIIQSILTQQNVLGIMPTGGGNRFVISCQRSCWMGSPWSFHL